MKTFKFKPLLVVSFFLLVNSMGDTFTLPTFTFTLLKNPLSFNILILSTWPGYRRVFSIILGIWDIVWIMVRKPSELNDLDNINHKMGFWIYITEPGGVLYQYFGTKPTENQTIALHPGWNLVGYPSLAIKNRTTALNNLTFGNDVDSILCKPKTCVTPLNIGLVTR